jgi:hypothetical protein
MAVLVWRHNTTREVARQTIQAELEHLGHDRKVSWKGDSAVASVGFGSILSASGEITDESIILHKCNGMAGGIVLRQCQMMLERLFPGPAAG